MAAGRKVARRREEIPHPAGNRIGDTIEFRLRRR
jgi:hypothetical protein